MNQQFADQSFERVCERSGYCGKETMVDRGKERGGWENYTRKGGRGKGCEEISERIGTPFSLAGDPRIVNIETYLLYYQFHRLLDNLPRRHAMQVILVGQC